MADEIKLSTPPPEKTLEFRATEKYNLWLKYFTDRSNKTTYFNSTQSAIAAYNYDPVEQYNTAAQTGHYNLKKTKELAHIYAEHNGITYDKMLGFAVNQMFKPDNPRAKEWWDSLMEQFGYADDKAGIEVNIPIQINNKIQEEFNKYR